MGKVKEAVTMAVGYLPRLLKRHKTLNVPSMDIQSLLVLERQEIISAPGCRSLYSWKKHILQFIWVTSKTIDIYQCWGVWPHQLLLCVYVLDNICDSCQEMPGGFFIVALHFSVIKQWAINLEPISSKLPFQKCTIWHISQKKTRLNLDKTCRKILYSYLILLLASKDKTSFYQVTLKKYSSVFIWPRAPRDRLTQRVQFLASVMHCVLGASARLDTQVIHTVIGLLWNNNQAVGVSHPSSFHHKPSPLTLHI